MVKKKPSVGGQIFGNIVVYGVVGLITIPLFGIFGVIFTGVALFCSLKKIKSPQGAKR